VPKPTFFNLPDDKRERFVAEARDEFARHPYDSASLSAIIARLGIAKGSVYQYFDDKRDLFQWLVLEAAKHKKMTVARHMPSTELPFFERLEAMYVAGLEFWREEPLWARLSLRVLEPSKDEKLEAFRRTIQRMGLEFVTSELEQAKREGAIRTDLDPVVVGSLMLATLQHGLINAYLARAGLDLSHLDDDPARAAELPETDILHVVKATLSFLRDGIGS